MALLFLFKIGFEGFRRFISLFRQTRLESRQHLQLFRQTNAEFRRTAKLFRQT